MFAKETNMKMWLIQVSYNLCLFQRSLVSCEHIAMDFIEGLPKSQGKNIILVVIDRFTKYAHFFSLTHPFSAEQIAQLSIDNICKLHEVPSFIVSDRDPIFTSSFWKELFKFLKVQLRMSSAYHPP